MTLNSTTRQHLVMSEDIFGCHAWGRGAMALSGLPVCLWERT